MENDKTEVDFSSFVYLFYFGKIIVLLWENNEKRKLKRKLNLVFSFFSFSLG